MKGKEDGYVSNEEVESVDGNLESYYYHHIMSLKQTERQLRRMCSGKNQPMTKSD
jgi:hypothetical protein